MNASLRFGIFAGFVVIGVIMLIAFFGWPGWSLKDVGSWLLLFALAASLVMGFFRWRQDIKRG